MADTEQDTYKEIAVDFGNVDWETGTPVDVAKSPKLGVASRSPDNVEEKDKTGTDVSSKMDVPQIAIGDMEQKLSGDEEGKSEEPQTWRQRSITWIKEKEPSVRESLRKTKSTLGQGWQVVSTFTKHEAKLIGSQVKWAYYCRNDRRTDEAEFVNTLNLLMDWKATLKAQVTALRRMIKYQKAYETNQENLSIALQKVPDNSDCGKSSVELGAAVEKSANKLVPTLNLEEVLAQIEELLKNEYTAFQVLKKNYDIVMNNLDVCKKKIDFKGETDNYKSELEKLTHEHNECKQNIVQLADVVLQKQNTTLVSVFLQASQKYE